MNHSQPQNQQFNAQPRVDSSNYQHFMQPNSQGAQGQPTKLSQLPGSTYQPVSHANPSAGHNPSAHGHEPEAKGHGATHGEGGHGGHGGHGGYNPLAMPCNWEVARVHGQCRRTAPDKKKDFGMTGKVVTCPCCGFELDRQDIPFCSDAMALSFLGSGFPLFYNFLKYCILILIIQLCIQQGYNLYTNYHGDYCAITKTEKLGGHEVHEPNCPDNIFLRMSMANKLNNHDAISRCQMLNFISLFAIMGVLLYFRKSQRQIDTTVDEEQLTPSDYTICVKNIPTGLAVDYQWEIKNIFENFAVLDSQEPIIVRKVVLVYNIEEICEFEKKLDGLVQKKKDAIRDNNFDFHCHAVLQVDEEIEHLEHQIHEVEAEYIAHNHKFAGIAFVSFDNETMKDLVLQENQHTDYERFRSYLARGKTPGLQHTDLSWHDHKLFLEPAPEPNDVDWEFIHITTHEKVFSRVKSWFYYFIFEGTAFFVIYLISLQLAKNVDEAHEEDLKGKIKPETMRNIEMFSYAISFSIVLFNKFGVAKIVHYIVDDEKISNKTKFQIAFAHKYAVALFTNAAIISYMVDIVILKNIQGYGGFLQNESQIFVLNAFFPPLIWLLDPWSCCKNIWRKYIMGKGDKNLLTQQEANLLMEEPDYLSAKRYSDVMKTMWFTFLYGTAIPLGTLFSAGGIMMYYFVDYYNILRRRTVKESISIQLSTEMIEMLEAIIFWSAFGNMTMSYAFFKEFSIYDILLLIISILYSIIPMEDVSACLFPVVNNEEQRPYAEGCIDFDTDYDRENPVTRSKAVKEWNAFISQIEQTGNVPAPAHVAPVGEFGYKADNRFAAR